MVSDDWCDSNYVDISNTMICLLAAMSDEDIDELVINYAEPLNVK